MLLLVVLSILVLFMLIGTAFLMSSNQYRNASKASAKHDRVGSFPTKSLDDALMQVLRDTGNPSSVVRYHSLLRDLDGSEGFEAMVYSPIDSDLNASFPSGNNGCQYTRYATPTNGAPTAGNLGPTQGQLIDIYVREHAFRRDDRLILGSETLPSAPDARNVIKLEKSPLGLPEMYNMPLTKGYFNGCLLTVTSGPARGQSTRIVDYEYVGDITIPAQTANSAPAPYPVKANTRLFRFRVMAFPNAAGNPLLTRNQLPMSDSRRTTNAARGLEIADLVAAETRNTAGTTITGTTGATIVVNGRPFNGTGAGFNELAKAGEPRLNARSGIQLGTVADPTAGSPAESTLHPEIALTPNAKFFFASDPLNANSTTPAKDSWGARYPNAATKTYDPLNPTSLTKVPLASRPLLWKYQTFVGPGDADESYDAPDFENMALAMQTVTPRATARVVQGNASSPVTLDVSDPAVNSQQFLRLDLEDLPIPSFFRPDLANYWFHRLAQFAADPKDGVAPITDAAVAAVLEPYGPDGIRGNGDDPGISVEIRDQIVAIKRMISLRPLREDHPNFDGSNPASRPPDLKNASNLVRGGNIAIPFWEAVGPWDVDNDNDGVPDSVWVDLGDPVAQAEDGTLYKPLYAFLIVDLDSRLNVNAHGLTEDLYSPQLDSTINPQTNVGFGNLAHDVVAGGLNTSNYLPTGSGYGPAEISLRSVFSPNLPGNSDLTLRGRVGNPAFDDYARILVGRPAVGSQPSVWGRHGSVDIRGNAAINWTIDANATAEATKVRPGIPYNSTIVPGLADPAFSDRLALFKFFGYPVWSSDYHGDLLSTQLPKVPSEFSNPPDMMGRYAVGLDPTGQPVDETAADTYYYGNRSLIVDSPYELNLSDPSRRDPPAPSVAATIAGAKTSAIDDDAPFATADLERILRAHDADAGILPDRLWNVVDAFDPVKLFNIGDTNNPPGNQPALVEAAAQNLFKDSSLSATDPNDRQKLFTAAQQLAEVNRRLVTTDSYDLPVPGSSILSRLTYGADGKPGAADVDDDGSNGADDPSELGWANSDDWYAIMYRGRAGYFNTAGAPTPPAGVRIVPDHPTIVDLFNYRVQYERWKINGVPYTDAELLAAAQYLLPPEVIAGQRMDLNRPFGDGRDNGDGIDNDGNGLIDDPAEMTYPVGDPRRDPSLNGIVDEPEEAGEPFIDANGNGKFDAGEYFYDLSNGGTVPINDPTKYNGPRDTLWQGLTGEKIGFNYTYGGDVTDGRLVDVLPPGNPDGVFDGRLRNNGIIARQTYARHLYCLMMLLMDESYVASQNMRPDDQGNVAFLDDKGNFDMFILHQQLALEMALKSLWDSGNLDASTNVDSTAFKTLLGNEVAKAKQFGGQIPAYQWMLRKLTARRIAQWAINVVDFRDADSVMTPFEYDENPFDGWGCTEYDPATGQPKVDPVTGKPRVVPLDNDIATNENWGDDFPAPRKFDPTRPINTDWRSPDYNVDNDMPPVRIDTSLPPGRQIIRESATRDVVWGTERPELLITETLALHDRRATDEEDLAGYPKHHSFNTQPKQPTATDPPDYDLDQKQKPRGSLFVELYNPWPADGNKPAELYGAPTGSGVAAGVMLNRLSTLADSVTNKKSPVWRMTVFNDPFTGKLSTQLINMNGPEPPNEQAAQQILSTDPDGYGVDMDQNAERFVYFTTGDDYTTSTDKTAAGRVGDESDPDRSDDNKLTTDLAGVKADYHLDTTTNTYLPAVDELSVRVPPLPIRWSTAPGSGSTTLKPYPAAKRYFIARTVRRLGMPANSDRDVAISPILPGRYAVIGSSGIQLNASGDATGITTRFVTPISQLVRNTGQADWDMRERTDLYQTRRIELWPNPNRTAGVADPNRTDPNVQQVLIGENGGPEFVRADINGDGVVAPDEIVNVTDSQRPSASKTTDPPGFGVPDNTIIDPCVAIPIEDLNVSEPVEGYPSLLYRKLYVKNNSRRGVTPLPDDVPVKITQDGEYIYEHSFDRPLDVEMELTRNGTTQNYRTLHLQRLADPSLPWNPPPFDDNGKPTNLHRPWLPVNPYLTIDSQSVDLTAYNSATQLERTNTFPVKVTPGALNPVLTANDPFQGNFFAPLTTEEVADAPDQVLWALIFVLKQEINGHAPLIDPKVWKTPAGLRAEMEIDPKAFQVNYLMPLSQYKGSTDNALRNELVQDRTGVGGIIYDGIWCWHMFRRVLPDDIPSGNDRKTGSFRQWLSMKSLERGAQDKLFFTPYARSPFYAKYNSALADAPSGWAYDPNWTPRLLWQQTRPNARLFVKTLKGDTVEASDLKNTASRRIQATFSGTSNYTTSESQMRIADDEIQRNRDIWARMRGGTAPSGGAEHVVDYVLEQTLGFANSTYAPELDRRNSNNKLDETAIMSMQRPGAPQVAVTGSPIEPVSQGQGLGDPDAVLFPDMVPYRGIPKEVLNSPRLAAKFDSTTGGNAEVGSLEQSLADTVRNGGPNAASASQDLAAVTREFYERRQQLMKSTYPWLAWNDRPFTSAEELMQVPSWSSSLLLHEYTVANPGTRDPYSDAYPSVGEIFDDGSKIGSTDVRVSTLRYAAQQAPFGHLLNFFLSSLMPAQTKTNPIGYSGAPKFYRLLDYVEVPSRYVGTETLLSPDIFNDVLGLQDGVAAGTVGSDIPGPTDPRFALQPPFNKISRQRDPGKVNLNTVTGRRKPPTPDSSYASGFTAPHIWSEVYDGIMHRYEDGNLLANPGVANPTVLQLSHFGPAWRDVELSRRGYAQFNADGGGNSVEKLDAAPNAPDQFDSPDTFAFGLNPTFPTVFSNPFRSADAGDLVPLANMVRPGVEATWLRSHPYARARDSSLETNPFASSGTVNSKIAWGEAGFDDDRNGIVDDISEAGYADNNGTDGDRIRIDQMTKAIVGSGIPLFSEEVPQPSLDGERNPGMMYQPMTRLGNLVTTRSNVYAIWVTVGYFEVEKAPDFADAEVQRRFGGDGSWTPGAANPNDVSVRARALYDRVYPDGYTLGEELGTDTGDTKRQRAFYIIDRTEPVGFKPGEDLNVDKMIRVRRRIE